MSRFRISGAAGNALPTVPPGFQHCGTNAGGWLSGWDHSQGDPANTYDTPGSFPSLDEGQVSGVVCFDATSMVLESFEEQPGACHWSATIKIVNCGEFLLFKLPDVPCTEAAYCTTTTI